MPVPIRRFGILLCDNVLATSATLPIEMMKTATATARGLGIEAPRVEIHTVSTGGLPVASASDFNLSTTTALETAPQFDLVHVPGQWRNPRRAIRQHPEHSQWLRDQHQGGGAITSVGTGVCFVAEAGLLNGKPATTHWHYFDQFQKDYPRVQLKRQYFITQAGNLYCAASVNTLAELLVHIIFLWFGRNVANNVERNFFHEIRGTFEPRRFMAEEVEYYSDEDILQAAIWLQDNYARKVSMPQLARQFGMSTRSFNRRFRNALGRTPVDYLQHLRLTSARELLQQTNLSQQEIGALCGYQDVSYFTRLFHRHFQITPGKYRETVRAKLFS
ncbi:MAG: AraC family transcriptional regulator [Porticoccaceae bacterium]|nr:AraC family transcriptional regulator [Porticoccaceae bacterium]